MKEQFLKEITLQTTQWNIKIPAEKIKKLDIPSLRRNLRIDVAECVYLELDKSLVGEIEQLYFEHPMSRVEWIRCITTFGNVIDISTCECSYKFRALHITKSGNAKLILGRHEKYANISDDFENVSNLVSERAMATAAILETINVYLYEQDFIGDDMERLIALATTFDWEQQRKGKGSLDIARYTRETVDGLVNDRIANLFSVYNIGHYDSPDFKQKKALLDWCRKMEVHTTYDLLNDWDREIIICK